MNSKAIRAAMIMNNYNQELLAKEIKMSPSALSNKLNNKTEFSRSEMAAISKVLGEDVKTLFFCEPE